MRRHLLPVIVPVVLLTVFALAGLVSAGCGRSSRAASPAAPSTIAAPTALPTPRTAPHRSQRPPSRAQIVARFGHERPRHFALNLPGTLTHVPRSAGIALTFDACGGRGGDGYDRALIALLRRHRIHATLFLNARWIAANPRVAVALARDPLFDVESHGLRHIPLSMDGRAAYGITGTRGAGGIYDELTGADPWFVRQLGRRPALMRPGTAFTDDVAIRIARAAGRRIVGFAVNADDGATAPAATIAARVAALQPGQIVIAHMNHPTHSTAAGFAAGLPRLLARHVRFTTVRAALAASAR